MKIGRFAILMFLILSVTACSRHTQPSIDSPAGNFLAKQGYIIIRQEGSIYEHKLIREDLTKLPHQMYWSVQSVDASQYIGKTIYTSTFLVKNHPLDRAGSNPKNQTIVYVMETEDEVIGGYSLPDINDPVDGWVYSLEGQTLEELSGTDYGSWKEQWDKKYK